LHLEDIGGWVEVCGSEVFIFVDWRVGVMEDLGGGGDVIIKKLSSQWEEQYRLPNIQIHGINFYLHSSIPAHHKQRKIVGTGHCCDKMPEKYSHDPMLPTTTGIYPALARKPTISKENTI
jgi:hypothetical protein